jgi:hypothetical protein
MQKTFIFMSLWMSSSLAFAQESGTFDVSAPVGMATIVLLFVALKIGKNANVK